jgi:hypothetical protein
MKVRAQCAHHRSTPPDRPPSIARGLVAGAESGAIVAVEVFVELQAIAPVRILLEFRGAAENRSAPSGPRRKIADKRSVISSAT